MTARIRRRSFLRGAAGITAAAFMPTSRLLGDPPCELTQLTDAEFEALAAGLDPRCKVILPTNADYHEARVTWNGVYNPLPVAIVEVRRTTDVQATVDWCRARGIHPRIRCGGHSFAGYSMGDTVIIDLREMNDVTLDDQIATVGGGASLGTVYCDLYTDHDRTIPAGSCKTVGISGLTMVGGYGDLTRKHGLTSDRALSAEVVLADGSVVTASSRSEPDLFWALRGGGSGSYGVVTSWTFETFPYVPRSYMYVWWDWAHMPEAFVAWQDWLTTLPRSYGSSFSINATPSPNFKIVLFGDTGAADFESLAQDLASRLTATANTAGPNGLPSPACSWDHTVSYGVQKSRLTTNPLSIEAMQTVKNAFDSRSGNSDLQGTSAFLLFDGLRGSILDHPADFNAYNHRSALCSAQFGARWTSLGTDPVAQKASTDWQRSYYEAIHDAFDGGCYQGYWDPEVENWAEMYYGTAFDRLRAAKSTYDPDQFFRFQRSIPPA